MANLAAAYGFPEADNKTEKVEIEALLARNFMDYNKDAKRYCAIKLLLPQMACENILNNLIQMNITAETLFGGIDGLAKSLVQKIIRT